jgi:hypothetical protein
MNSKTAKELRKKAKAMVENDDLETIHYDHEGVTRLLPGCWREVYKQLKKEYNENSRKSAS